MENLWEFINLSDVGIAVTVGAVIVWLSAILTRILNARSFAEKTKRKILDQYSIEDKELRHKIELEKDDEIRQELRQLALDLHQKYESLLIEDLRTKDNKVVDDWREVPLAARRRLLDEEDRLRLRSRINLLFGFIMVMFGAGITTAFILIAPDSVPNDVSLNKFFNYYLPRMPIVISIEGLAIFFFRLYVVNERELLYNKNRIMNIELRLTSGLMLVGTKENTAKFESLSNHLAREGLDDLLGKKSASGGISAEKLVKILLKALKVT